MSKYFVDSVTLKDFEDKCDVLCKSKLILADKKISNLLKTIAASEDFCKFIKQCLEGFNYEVEFMKCKKPDDAKKGKFKLKLPENETLIAFVFCLLCDFENKEKDLTNFLIEYYDFNELFADGYKNFCESVIIPFKNTVTLLCVNSEELDISPILQHESTLTIEKEQYIKILAIYQELCRNIEKEGRLKAEDRNKYKSVADAFIHACKENNALYINALLYSLLYMCSDYRFLNSKVKLIDSIINKKEL